MALLDFLRSTVPVDANAQSGFTQGAEDYMRRRRAGLENQRLTREENFRKMEMNRPPAQFNTEELAGQINTGLRNIPAEVVREQEGAGGVDANEEFGYPGATPKTTTEIPSAITNETPFPGQITFPEYEQPDLSGLFPEGTTEKTDAQAEEKEALHVQGMPWKVAPKGNGQVLVHNGVEYDIKDVFGDGSSFQIVDRYGRPNFPLTDAFTKGRAQGIVNTEINVGDVDTNVATPQAPTQNKFIDNAVASVKNDKFRNIQSQLTVEQARLIGIPEGEALALLAIESNFGNTPFTGRKAKGALQIEAPAFTDVKQFYAGKMPAGANPAEWARLKNIAAGLPKNFSGLSDNRDQITASLLYFKLIKYKGVDPKFQGAAYNDGYSKFIGINSLQDVKKFAKNHDYNSVNTYNRAFVSLQGYLGQVGNYFYPVSGGQTVTANVPTVGSTPSGASTTTQGNTVGMPSQTTTANTGGVPSQTPVDNTDRTATVDQTKTNVTDVGIDTKSTSEKIINNPKKTVEIVTKLSENPNRFGFEFSKALENRNLIAGRIENMRRAGLTGINRPEYAKGIADLMVLDSALYVMQAMDALQQFKNTRNPSRLNAVLDAFTGGTALIQARSDGKFDFIKPDGTIIDKSLSGLTDENVTRVYRTVVDSKFRSTIEASEAANAKARVASKLKMLEEANKISIQAIANILEKNAETKLEQADDGSIITITQGGIPMRSYQKTTVTQEIDGKSKDVETWVPIVIPEISFGTGSTAQDPYSIALKQIGLLGQLGGSQ